jgi:hypothetical protein
MRLVCEIGDELTHRGKQLTLVGRRRVVVQRYELYCYSQGNIRLYIYNEKKS